MLRIGFGPDVLELCLEPTNTELGIPSVETNPDFWKVVLISENCQSSTEEEDKK